MREHAVEQHGEALAPAVADKPRYVVLHRPEILPGIALADVGRVVIGVERTHKFAVAAAGLGRRFLCVDQNPLAVAVTAKRLLQSPAGRETGFAFEVEAPCGEDDCRVEAEVYPAISSYTVRLSGFDSPAARAARIERLDAVDSWSAGFVQGDVFRSCVSSVRSPATPGLKTVMEMPVCAGEPCIMIVDIWGSRRFYLPKRRY